MLIFWVEVSILMESYFSSFSFVYYFYYHCSIYLIIFICTSLLWPVFFRSISPGVLHLCCVIVRWLDDDDDDMAREVQTIFVRHKTRWWWYNLQFKIESFTCSPFLTAVVFVGKEEATPSSVYYTLDHRCIVLFILSSCYLFILGFLYVIGGGFKTA